MATQTLTKPQARIKVKPVAARDPLWFKDSVIYQLHVRAFYDSNGDGIGDFAGLTQKLDYLQDLGVTAIWLLPFFPSPLRDDGYDTSDYTQVNSIYGSMRDFKQFLREAHRRDLRVITEMVMNHTSDQHEWFQKSRRARPGSKWRNYYVWSDDPSRYADARIIFQDFEQSNWTWDPVAEAYFWHRFYSHQPDLNFDNPEVHRAMFKSVEHWLAMGVDAFRLDAVPYLYEREGTNCENLSETHAFLRKLRAYVDERFEDKMLLAEANQWPEDAVAYFGDGDECHMNFHFPLMPRLFMAIEREDRFPVIDILEQTPEIHDNCQWGIFLRNHDELTLEMVTDEERDYMYRAYADDPRARVNLGIRRRLAPLLKNNRRKIELMNALLLSLPGTPIIYYGDELGMGDNIYLGDRDGVRTPMQWNGDRNAGFSRANPQRLYLPPVIDADYHYASVNVEVQQNSPHSLLWWMRRIIHLRKQYLAFGRGSMEFLTPDNAKVLAYLREYENERILVVANLSRFAQGVQLDLSRFRGQTPVELFGKTRFPPIGELPYFLTLGPYAFFWFRLDWRSDEIASVGIDLPVCTISENWDALFAGRPKAILEQVLPKYLMRQRWFAGKARAVQNLQVLDVFTVESDADGPAMRLLLIEVAYVEGEPETYLMPVVFAQGAQAANITGDHPRGGILRIQRSDTDESATLCEAMWEEQFWRPLYTAMERKRTIKGLHGEIQSEHTRAFRRLAANLDRLADSDHPATIQVFGGQQSNTSVMIGNQFILKVFRRLSPGENPDLEIGRFFTHHTQLSCVPEVAGALVFHPSPGEGNELATTPRPKPITLGILHQFVANEGDAWSFTLDELGRYMERVEAHPDSESTAEDAIGPAALIDLVDEDPPEAVRELVGGFLHSARLLGERTAEMHVALASGTQSEFRPEPFSQLYQRSLYQSMRMQARRAFHLLRRQMKNLADDVRRDAEQVASLENAVLDRFGELLRSKLHAVRTRCHGDYHLGQVLYTGRDFVIIDFEGEPERPVSERRIKASPLRDVAGMLRSFHYASHAALRGEAPSSLVHGHSASRLEAWLHVWHRWTSAAFLQAYLSPAREREILPNDADELRILLDAYLLEKALYEMTYELNNRPDWIRIPLEGILQLVEPTHAPLGG